MPFNLKERFLKYPFLTMIIFIICINFGALNDRDNYLNYLYRMFISPFTERLDFLPPELVFFIYAYLFGYTYGLISLFIKTNKLRGIVKIFVIYAKFVFSAIFIMIGICILITVDEHFSSQ